MRVFLGLILAMFMVGSFAAFESTSYTNIDLIAENPEGCLGCLPDWMFP